MGLEFNAIIGIAHQCCEDIGIGEHTNLPQEARHQRQYHMIGEDHAQDAACQHDGIAADGQIFDAYFLGQRINDKRTDAGHGAGDHLVDGVHHGIFRAAQQELDVKVLHIPALIIVNNTADGGNDDEDHKILVGKQCLQLIPQGHFLLIQQGILCRHIFGNAFTGIVVFQKQQRNGRHRQADHQNGITFDVLFQPQGQHHHADHHANDDAGDQRPGHFADVLDKGFLLGITGDQGADGIPEQIEIGAANGMVANHQEEEIEPVDVAHIVAWEQENQAADNDGHESENQVPWTHSALAGFGFLDQPTVQQAHTHTQNLGGRHDDLIPAAHLHDHFHIPHAVHGAGLLGKEFLHQCSNGIDYEDQTQRSDQMTQDPFFGGYRVGGGSAVHKGPVKQAAAEQAFLFLFRCHDYFTSTSIVTGATPLDLTVMVTVPVCSPAWITARHLPR